MSTKVGDNTISAGLKKLPAFGYALLITAIFFLMDQFFTIEKEDSSINESLIQSALATFDNITSSSNSDFEDIERSPVMLIISEKATDLDVYGWPINMSVLNGIIDEVKDAGARSLFIDIVIRTARHDPAGFCGLIKSLAREKGLSYQGFSQQNNEKEESLELLSGDSCLNLIGEPEHVRDQQLINYMMEKREFHPEEFQTKILEPDSSSKMLLIFGSPAPTHYLNKRDEYFKAKNKNIPGDCPDKIKKSGENIANNFCGKRAAYINAILRWPGIALLDQVSVLAPVSILAKDKKSVHLRVGSKRHLSPAYILANRNRQYLGDTKNIPDEIYLSWRGTYKEISNDSSDHIHSIRSMWPVCENDESYQKSSFRKFVLPFFMPRNDPLPSARCPSYLAIDLGDFESGKINITTFQESLKNKDVILGTDLERFNDHISSPLHGQLPGIFSHATAIDNIINDKLYRTGTEKILGIQLSTFLLALKYGLYSLLVWVLLVYPRLLSPESTINTIFIKLRIRRKELTKEQIATFFGKLMLIAYLSFVFLNIPITNTTSPSPIQIFTSLLSLLSAVAILYIFFFSKGEKLKGFNTLSMHIIMIVVFGTVLVLLAMMFSLLITAAPPDVFSVFIYLLPLYLMTTRDDIAESFANLLGEKRIADNMMD